MSQIMSNIKTELKENADNKYRLSALKYHKEKVDFMGVKTTIVRKIAKKYFKEIKHLPKKELFVLCEELFESGNIEQITIGIQWAAQSKDLFEESDIVIFEQWIHKYITNWGNCDDFCLSLLSHFIVSFPKNKDIVKSWTSSPNRWLQRASAVGFIQGGSWKIHPDYLPDVLDVAQELFSSEDDLVQKGSGWSLKVAADSFQQEIFDFVMTHKKKMPRTTLRYAIEKMPKELKKQAMAKDW